MLQSILTSSCVISRPPTPPVMEGSYWTPVNINIIMCYQQTSTTTSQSSIIPGQQHMWLNYRLTPGRQAGDISTWRLSSSTFRGHHEGWSRPAALTPQLQLSWPMARKGIKPCSLSSLQTVKKKAVYFQSL